jgi:hypothetical protein
MCIAWPVAVAGCATADFGDSDHFPIKVKQLLFKSSELASQSRWQIYYASFDCIFMKTSNLQVEGMSNVVYDQRHCMSNNFFTLNLHENWDMSENPPLKCAETV